MKQSNFSEIKLERLLMEARKLEVDVAFHQMSWAEWEMHAENDGPPDWLIDKDDELIEPFEYLVKSIYLGVVCYLDQLGLENYLNLFFDKFGKDVDHLSGVLEFEIDYRWSGAPQSVWLSRIRQFLGVFPILEHQEEERYRRLSGIQYLENVLDATASIISKSKKKPSTEAQVYNSVKDILAPIFPSSISPKSNFLKSAKEYKPDILIPELNAAVEYKYANSEEKLKSTIEQIAIDVKGYTGDKDYNLFYAVFYVTEDFWGERKFKEFWKELAFPENWQAFYKVGTSA